MESNSVFCHDRTLADMNSQELVTCTRANQSASQHGVGRVHEPPPITEELYRQPMASGGGKVSFVYKFIN